MIGRERTGILSTNHMRAFRVAFSKAETGFKSKKLPKDMLQNAGINALNAKTWQNFRHVSEFPRKCPKSPEGPEISDCLK